MFGERVEIMIRLIIAFIRKPKVFKLRFLFLATGCDRGYIDTCIERDHCVYCCVSFSWFKSLHIENKGENPLTNRFLDFHTERRTISVNQIEWFLQTCCFSSVGYEWFFISVWWVFSHWNDSNKNMNMIYISHFLQLLAVSYFGSNALMDISTSKTK